MRNEFTLDLTDSKQFAPDIAKSGNIITVELKTEYSKVELVMDACDFEALINQGCLTLNKKKTA